MDGDRLIIIDYRRKKSVAEVKNVGHTACDPHVAKFPPGKMDKEWKTMSDMCGTQAGFFGLTKPFKNGHEASQQSQFQQFRIVSLELY